MSSEDANGQPAPPAARRLLGVAVAAVVVVAGATGAAALSDDGSEQGGTTTMVVPYEAGGGSDASGRAIADGLEKATGGSIAVENRVGGSGAVGYSYFLGREGDPRTLLAAETTLLNLPLTQDVSFDYTDFTPIMKLADDYTFVVVPADSPYRTCREVVDRAADHRVVAAVSGATSLDEIVFSLIEDSEGVELDRVPYESGSEVIAGLLGGEVEVASLNPGEVIGQIESGDLRALCSVSEERYTDPKLADVPTTREQGIDVSFAQFRGFIAPGGITAEQRQYWIDAAREFAQSPEYRRYVESNYLQPGALYGDDFGRYLAENNDELEKAIG